MRSDPAQRAEAALLQVLPQLDWPAHAVRIEMFFDSVKDSQHISGRFAVDEWH